MSHCAYDSLAREAWIGSCVSANGHDSLKKARSELCRSRAPSDGATLTREVAHVASPRLGAGRRAKCAANSKRGVSLRAGNRWMQDA